MPTKISKLGWLRWTELGTTPRRAAVHVKAKRSLCTRRVTLFSVRLVVRSKQYPICTGRHYRTSDGLPRSSFSDPTASAGGTKYRSVAPTLVLQLLPKKCWRQASRFQPGRRQIAAHLQLSPRLLR
mmetsp:Transcript_24002/g.74348  ORF Transcript_24002/g.74348 Transcript_24002/m.74348 type:complete len:126 (-) Transcript_24002:182-559(-)